LKYLLTLLLLLPSTVFASCKHRNLNQLSDRTGVQIHCDYDRDAYFNNSFKQNCKNTSAKSPRFVNPEFIENAIERFMRVYPKKLLTDNLKNIYLLSELRCGKYTLGGTYDETSKSIYLNTYTFEEGYLFVWYVKSLHHEFSSILQHHNSRQMSFPEFESISGANTYDESVVNDCLHNPQARCNEGSRELYQKGILHYYGTDSVENDFNIYVEYLFTAPKELSELAKNYPLINTKAQMVKRFYSYLGVRF